MLGPVPSMTLTTLDQVYDPNGDGQIDEGELKDIIISCVAENGMEFDEQQVISMMAIVCFRGGARFKLPGQDLNCLGQTYLNFPMLCISVDCCKIMIHQE